MKTQLTPTNLTSKSPTLTSPINKSLFDNFLVTAVVPAYHIHKFSCLFSLLVLIESEWRGSYFQDICFYFLYLLVIINPGSQSNNNPRINPYYNKTILFIETIFIIDPDILSHLIWAITKIKKTSKIVVLVAL